MKSMKEKDKRVKVTPSNKIKQDIDYKTKKSLLWLNLSPWTHQVDERIERIFLLQKIGISDSTDEINSIRVTKKVREEMKNSNGEIQLINTKRVLKGLEEEIQMAILNKNQLRIQYLKSLQPLLKGTLSIAFWKPEKASMFPKISGKYKILACIFIESFIDKRTISFLSEEDFFRFQTEEPRMTLLKLFTYQLQIQSLVLIQTLLKTNLKNSEKDQ